MANLTAEDIQLINELKQTVIFLRGQLDQYKTQQETALLAQTQAFHDAEAILQATIVELRQQLDELQNQRHSLLSQLAELDALREHEKIKREREFQVLMGQVREAFEQQLADKDAALNQAIQWHKNENGLLQATIRELRGILEKHQASAGKKLS